MLSCQTFEKSDLGLLFAWYFYCRKCFAITFWHPKMYLFRKNMSLLIWYQRYNCFALISRFVVLLRCEWSF